MASPSEIKTSGTDSRGFVIANVGSATVGPAGGDGRLSGGRSQLALRRHGGGPNWMLSVAVRSEKPLSLGSSKERATAGMFAAEPLVPSGTPGAGTALRGPRGR